MFTSIAGRSVIVTGGSKGIGKGISRAFAARGARVLLTARTAEELEMAAAEVRATGGDAIGAVANVSSLPDMERVAQRALATHGGIDIVCVNAGIFPSARLEEMREEDWEGVHDTNLKGTFLTVRVPACTEAECARAGYRNFLDHRTDYRTAGLVALCCQQGWTTRVHALGCARTRQVWNYLQCSSSREHSH
jgi:3-oxoacyl-[acyl-carrier protein] reductase